MLTTQSPPGNKLWSSRLTFLFATVGSAVGLGWLMVLIPLLGLTYYSVIAGWALPCSSTMDELGLGDSGLYRLWHVLIRYVVPVALPAVFISNL